MNIEIPDKIVSDAVRSALLSDGREGSLSGVARTIMAGLSGQIQERMREVATAYLTSSDFSAAIQKGLADAVRDAIQDEAQRVARKRVRALHDSGRGLFEDPVKES